MKKKAMALLLSLLLCGTATSVCASAEATNKAPDVIPAVREWEGYSGYFYLKKGMRLVIEGDDLLTDAQKDIIRGYFNDILGFMPEIVTGGAVSGDIRFNSTLPETRSVGEEGYMLVAEDIVDIYAPYAKGQLYGIITVLQSHVADGYMPKGKIFDVPYYPIRSGMIDVGRAYIPLEYVEEITKYFAWFKMNEIHLHINDNGSDGKGYFRLESNVPGLTSEEHYTKAEYRDYQKRMIEYGVDVVTEIDTPAHSRCFQNAVPQYMFDGSHIDINNSEAIQFICDLWDEYVTGDDPVFVSKTVHFGTDEFPDGYNEQMRSYTNTLIEHLRSRGLTPRFWGSFGGDGFNGNTPVSGDAQTNFWAVSLSDYKTLFKMGYDVINTCGPVLYCVPGGNYGFADYFDLATLYKNWFVNYMGTNSSTAVKADHPQLKGACFALWNDLWCDWGGFSVFDIFDRIRYQVCFIAEKTWCGEQTRKISPDDFVSRFNTLSTTTGGSNPGRHHELPVTLDNVSDISSIGFPYLFSTDINVSDYGDLLSGKDGRLFINAAGKIAFQRESYIFTYDYKVPKNTDINIKLYADNSRTILIVDDTWYYTPVNSRNNEAKKGGSTFVLPLESISSSIKSLSVSEIDYNINDFKANANLALGKKVTVSGLEVDYAFNESLAVDGHMDTRLSFARDKDEQWMIVDLGSVLPINKINIHYFERVSAYEIYVSEDGENYTKVYEISGMPDGTRDASDEITFDTVNARYVKYVQLKRWYAAIYNTYYSGGIKEFEVYRAMTVNDELLEEAKSISDSKVHTAYRNLILYLDKEDIFIPHIEGLCSALESAIYDYKNPPEESSEEEASEHISDVTSDAAVSDTLSSEDPGNSKKTFPIIPVAVGSVVGIAAIATAVALLIKKNRNQ